MKTMSFTYEDSKGKITDRNVAVLNDASDKVFTIDFTELSDEEAEDFILDLSDLLAEHKVEIDKLMKDYDLTHKYRQFFPTQMTNVVTETH